MIKITHPNGKSSPWFFKVVTRKELERASLADLLVLIKMKRIALKPILIDLLENKTINI